jgi:hypothetical protein
MWRQGSAQPNQRLRQTDVAYALNRHGLPATLSANIAGVIPLLQRADQE